VNTASAHGATRSASAWPMPGLPPFHVRQAEGHLWLEQMVHSQFGTRWRGRAAISATSHWLHSTSAQGVVLACTSQLLPLASRSVLAIFLSGRCSLPSIGLCAPRPAHVQAAPQMSSPTGTNAGGAPATTAAGEATRGASAEGSGRSNELGVSRAEFALRARSTRDV